jgi:hypothetical protein
MILSRYRYRPITVPLPFSGHREGRWGRECHKYARVSQIFLMDYE